MNSSELILNSDGTIFHLHLDSSMIAETILLVGDPARADMISGYFDSIRCSAFNREFRTYTGTYAGKEITVMSTGIGVGNIDIAINELMMLSGGRHLSFLRIGTCGAVSPDLHIGDYVVSEYCVGTDGLAFFYHDSESVRELGLESEFKGWPVPVYAVRCHENLVSLFDGFAHRCITVSGVGFYGPQGRNVLVRPWRDDVVEKLSQFRYNGLPVGNFEMEGAPISFLALKGGMSAATVCAVIAQRTAGVGQPDYQGIIRNLVEYTLKKISK